MIYLFDYVAFSEKNTLFDIGCVYLNKAMNVDYGDLPTFRRISFFRVLLINGLREPI